MSVFVVLATCPHLCAITVLVLMIYMFISVMLKIVFEDGQCHNEQIKLEFRINDICFGSMHNAHSFNLPGMAFCCQQL